MLNNIVHSFYSDERYNSVTPNSPIFITLFFYFLFIVSPNTSKDILSNNIIETKPIEHEESVEIKPSKTIVTNQKNPSEKKTSTIVQIKTQAEPSSSKKIEIKPSANTKVNVVTEKLSTAVLHPPLVVSKVQVSFFSTKIN